jgi:hypothetical protein
MTQVNAQWHQFVARYATTQRVMNQEAHHETREIRFDYGAGIGVRFGAGGFVTPLDDTGSGSGATSAGRALPQSAAELSDGGPTDGSRQHA